MLTNPLDKFSTLFLFVSCVLLCLPSLTFSQEWQGLSPGKAKETLSVLQIPFTNEAFFKAIREDDVRVVRLFHQAGLDLNTREDDSLGQTPPIYVAADWGSDKVFKYLLENNVDVNIRNQWNGWTALVRAISHEHHEMVWALLNAGAIALYDPTIGIRLATSALSYAITIEDPVLVKELLKPVRLGSVMERSFLEETPLMRASRSPSVQVVKLLLEAGASVTDVDNVGSTGHCQFNSGLADWAA